MRLAIIGQPNAGKSTLVNTILGEDRMLTGPEAGITRDAISSEFEWRGQKIKLWDTAGIRRKSRVVGKIEKLAVSDALRAIRFAECVVVLIDASLPIERQDLSLCDLVAGEGRAVVLALSKWDLVEEKQKKLKEVQSDLEDVLPEIRGVPVVTLSAKQEKGIDKLLEAVLGAMERWNSRIPTAQVNRWLEGAIERNPPPAPSGRRIKIRYATQASARPPTFAIFGNQLSKLPESYIRYLMNGLRESLRPQGRPHPLQPARRQEPVRQGQVGPLQTPSADRRARAGREGTRTTSELHRHLAQMLESTSMSSPRPRRRTP